MLKKYFPFLRASMMNVFIYRGTIWLWILVDVFRYTMLIFLWISVYRNADSINGFTLNEMVLYYLLISMTQVFSQSNVLFTMTDEIRQGKFSLYLIKPIKYKVRLYFESLGDTLGGALLVVPIAIISILAVVLIFKISMPIHLWQIASFIAYIPLIMLFFFEFSFLFGILMIYTENNFGLVILMGVTIRALSGQLIPLAFYPEGLRNILNLLPFQFFSYPPLIILNKLTQIDIIKGLGILISWIIIFKIINKIVFKLSLKRMVVFGG